MEQNITIKEKEQFIKSKEKKKNAREKLITMKEVMPLKDVSR